jgi:membrane protease YdiL (CAAX protease family)
VSFRDWIARYQVPIFFVVAYLLTWSVWGSAVAQQQKLLAFRIPGGVAYYLLTVAVVAVAAVAGGRKALLDLVHRCLRWRVGLGWYLAAALVPVALAFGCVAIYWWVAGQLFVGRMLALRPAGLYLLRAIPIWLVTEELAWRGFALPRLQRRTGNALTASLVLGMIWALWHTPLFFIQGISQHDYGWPYLGFVLLVPAESVLTTWLFNSTRGSVLIAALFHTFSRAALSYSGALAGGAGLFWLAVAAFWLAAVSVVLLAGPKSLSRRVTLGDPSLLPPERRPTPGDRGSAATGVPDVA